MFSISPVPQTPWPVSYIHCESMPLPAPPEKESLNTVDQPDGGPGTVVADADVIATALVSVSIMAGTASQTRARRSRDVRVLLSRDMRMQVIRLLDRLWVTLCGLDSQVP
jgi:hypothetical protein